MSIILWAVMEYCGIIWLLSVMTYLDVLLKPPALVGGAFGGDQIMGIWSSAVDEPTDEFIGNCDAGRQSLFT